MTKFLQLEEADNDCTSFLAKALHQVFEQRRVEDLEADAEEHPVCFSVSGGCRSTPRWDKATSFVKAFNNCIIDNHVRVGNLMSIRNSQTGDLHVFFLGVCLRRPTLHVLIRASLQANGLCEFARSGSRDRIRVETSWQLFKDILSSSGEDISQLQAEVLEYRASFSPDNGQRMKVCVSPNGPAAVKTFIIDRTVRYPPRKQRPKLPFGLKLPGTKQKTQSKRPKKAAAKKKRGKPDGGAKGAAVGVPRDVVAVSSENSASEKPSDEEDSDEDSGSSSGNESSTATSSRAQGDVETSEVLADSISSRAVREAKAAVSLTEEHDTKIAEVTEQYQGQGKTILPASKLSSAPATTYKSYFRANTGLDSIGFAASARSKCFDCQEMIAKKAIRFSWYYNCAKPLAWVHKDCLASITRKTKHQEQVLSQLQALQTQELASDLKAAVRDQFRKLNGRHKPLP